ncbi:hypothetical protein [Mucilaginibacter paludis]|uniref:Uncharacterized protein n=1 Tax=Mucilaginibacter paludis DSM 18603 TaxID=714943 RepID=H1Y7A7_9SPHI|nr:hypothetical protein [Mucilaginibacter paludis]EHQ28994.1 hypothetical protein Mucpa_4910 [Mucilaginibacter paludis DSM 18603]
MGLNTRIDIILGKNLEKHLADVNQVIEAFKARIVEDQANGLPIDGFKNILTELLYLGLEVITAMNDKLN